jgi:hypothetical protein
MNAKRGRGGDVKYCPPSQRRRCHRSTRGPSRNSADTTRQRAGHQRGLLHSESTTERNRGARGTTSTGGGRVTAHAATPTPPVDAWAIEQCSRHHHPSTCGPSTRTPPQRHHDQTQCRRQGDDERGGGGRGATCAAMRLTPPASTRRPSTGC